MVILRGHVAACVKLHAGCTTDTTGALAHLGHFHLDQHLKFKLMKLNTNILKIYSALKKTSFAS